MTTRKQYEEAEKLLRDFDWSKVDALTDEQIIAAAKSDPDSSLPTAAELKEFKLIPAKSRRKPPGEAAE